MPYKSRRSRRDFPSKRKSGSLSDESGTLIADSTAKITSPVLKGISAINKQKPAEASNISAAYFWSELKWIGIVTFVILILLVISCFVFR